MRSDSRAIPTEPPCNHPSHFVGAKAFLLDESWKPTFIMRCLIPRTQLGSVAMLRMRLQSFVRHAGMADASQSLRYGGDRFLASSRPVSVELWGLPRIPLRTVERRQQPPSGPHWAGHDAARAANVLSRNSLFGARLYSLSSRCCSQAAAVGCRRFAERACRSSSTVSWILVIIGWSMFFSFFFFFIWTLAFRPWLLHRLAGCRHWGAVSKNARRRRLIAALVGHLCTE